VHPSRLALRTFAAVVSAGILAAAACELWLRWFPLSDSVAGTLTAQAWRRQCWRTGPDGFRPHPGGAGPATVVVVGDSVAAGYGLCDPAARFASQLGDRYRVWVLAEAGDDTRDEWAHLERFLGVRPPPDALVVSYLGNLIEGAALEHGIPVRPPAPPLPVFVGHSYAGNFLFWHRRVDLAPYLAGYRRAWREPSVVHAHLEEVGRFFTLNLPVVFLVWPIPMDPELTRSYVPLVSRHARSLGGVVVDVDRLTADLSPRQWTVNRFDAHPSAAVHRRVAAELREVLDRLLPPGPRTTEVSRTSARGVR